MGAVGATTQDWCSFPRKQHPMRAVEIAMGSMRATQPFVLAPEYWRNNTGLMFFPKKATSHEGRGNNGIDDLLSWPQSAETSTYVRCFNQCTE